MRKLILWVVDEAHRQEQAVSEASVKRHMPDVDTRCFIARREGTWYDVYIKTLQETLYLPYDQFLFLDSDTYLLEPVYDLFEVLEKYDVVSTHAPARQTTDMPTDVIFPDAYCELNTGVFGYRSSGDVAELFETWLGKYYLYLPKCGDNDQAPLRMAMFELGTKVWVMPEEYNFRWGFGGFVGSKVKILHGRSQNIEKLAQEVNAEKSMRTFKRGQLQ